jgi:hypothetical protein
MFTATLNEDEANIDAVKQMWEMFGVADMQVEHPGPHTYVLSGKRAGLDTSFEIKCAFDPATGALRIVDTDGGEVVELFEFVPLAPDKFVFQTRFTRTMVTYRDGKVESFLFSQNESQKELAYGADTDGIYPNGGGADDSWVSAAGEETYGQFLVFDGDTLSIAADTFMGERVTFAIGVE